VSHTHYRPTVRAVGYLKPSQEVTSFLKMGWVRPKRGCLLTLAYYAFPRLYEFGERRWNDVLTGENRRTLTKTCPSATLSTTNLTWTDPGLRGDKPATNDLSHGTAQEVPRWRYFIRVLVWVTCFGPEDVSSILIRNKVPT
jgi:hypothetical protein